MTPTYLFFSIEFRNITKTLVKKIAIILAILPQCYVVVGYTVHALMLVLAGGGLLREPFSPWFLCVSFTFQVILSTHAYILPEEISKL